jgi:hypothetical protein
MARRWLSRGLAAALALVVVAVGLFVVLTRNPSPDAFYDPPEELAGAPGSIIRSEPFTAGVPAGARAWRVLYRSTDPGGKPIAVSGLIVAPADPRGGPRPVLAWAHGTLGVARACAPSLSKDPFAGIPDMKGPLAAGWVIAMTDYPGLGTPGPHPYLVGESEGRAVLDSVRAAHALDGPGVPLDRRYAIWGHSQGGQSALFAGQLAPAYLDEYELAGVAALSPATTLRENLAAIEGTQGGNVLTLFALASWSRYYTGIDDSILVDDARGPARRIGESCVNEPSRVRIAAAAARLPNRVLAVDVADDPAWKPRLERNSPAPSGIRAPLFVAQGVADELIAPEVTTAWVERRRAAGGAIDFKSYPGVTHPAVVGAGGADALAWTKDKLNGQAL